MTHKNKLVNRYIVIPEEAIAAFLGEQGFDNNGYLNIEDTVRDLNEGVISEVSNYCGESVFILKVVKVLVNKGWEEE